MHEEEDKKGSENRLMGKKSKKGDKRDVRMGNVRTRHVY